MDLLMWLAIAAFAVVGFMEFLKNYSEAIKTNELKGIIKGTMLLMLSPAIAYILKMAKFEKENDWYIAFLAIVILGIAQLAFEWFIKAEFIKGLLKKVFGVDFKEN